jgi:hypothetical protein
LLVLTVFAPALIPLIFGVGLFIIFRSEQNDAQ